MKRLLKIVLPLIGKGGLLKYSFIGIFSGLCSFLFINAVTRVIGLLMAGQLTSISREYIIAFASIILLFVWTRRVLSLAIIQLSQRIFWSLRRRILSYVLNANYDQLQSRRTRIYTSVVNDVGVLTEASFNIIHFFTSSILTITCLIYLASISLVLFGITVGITMLGMLFYHFGTRRDIIQFEKARKLDEDFMAGFNSILNGFKEIFMDPYKGQVIYKEKIMKVANQSFKNNTSAFAGFLNNQIIGQILFYLLISAILLVFSVTLSISAADTVSFVFTLLYLLGGIESIMVLLPGLARARVSAKQLVELEEELEKANFSNPVSDKIITRNEFESIAVNNLEYYYGDQEKSFGIGPIDLEIKKGETIFIYGGNGSGKTTFVQTLIGLRLPTAGEIKLNDAVLLHHQYPLYKTLFSVVFSDFYLFGELLSVDNFKKEKWEYYLKLFEIETKVSIEDKIFTTTDLSTGQRKRLALIAALMEEKPVLVIDEWAADQDPYFRKKFYTEIIALLREEGVTIIAITHDDKYYYCADKLYKMDEGKLYAESIHNHAGHAMAG